MKHHKWISGRQLEILFGNYINVSAMESFKCRTDFMVSILTESKAVVMSRKQPMRT